jgi:hypothetical protein
LVTIALFTHTEPSIDLDVDATHTFYTKFYILDLGGTKIIQLPLPARPSNRPTKVSSFDQPTNRPTDGRNATTTPNQPPIHKHDPTPQPTPKLYSCTQYELVTLTVEFRSLNPIDRSLLAAEEASWCMFTQQVFLSAVILTSKSEQARR